MKREEHGRRHLTKEQLSQVLASKDAAAEKHIPDSAKRQMAHRPYQKKGENHAKTDIYDNSGGIQDKRQKKAEEKI